MTVPSADRRNREALSPSSGAHDGHDGRRRPTRVPVGGVLAAALGVGLILVVIATASSGVRGDQRLGVPGSQNLSIVRTPFLGYDNWPLFFSVTFFVVSAVLLGYYALASWRARAIRYELVVFAALVGVSWWDPLGNWATQASFDPRFLHFPATLPWANIAPGIEPLMTVVGYPFLFLTVALLAQAIVRRTPAARLTGTRALVAVGAIGLATGVVLDITAQVFMMNAHMYVYLTHVPPALVWGDAVVPWMAVLYDSVGIATTTVLLWVAGQRNAKGEPPRGLDVVRAWLILSAAVLVVIALGGILRAIGLMDQTFDGPWPFPEMVDGRPV